MFAWGFGSKYNMTLMNNSHKAQTFRLFLVLLSIFFMIFETGCNIDNWFGNFKEDMYIDTTSEIKFHAYTMNNDDSYTVRERIGNVVNSEELMNLYKSEDNSKQYVKPGWELSGWKIYKVQRTCKSRYNTIYSICCSKRRRSCRKRNI